MGKARVASDRTYPWVDPDAQPWDRTACMALLTELIAFFTLSLL
jgi:hypothetical protein